MAEDVASSLTRAMSAPIPDDGYSTGDLVPHGWAPGGNFCRACRDCGEGYSGDKRCRRYRGCAVKSLEAKASAEIALSEAVKARRAGMMVTDRRRRDDEALRHMAERDDPEAAEASMNARLFAGLQAANGDRDALMRACRRADLRRVELSLVDGGGPDPALDAYMELILRSTPLSVYDAPDSPAPYTGSLDAARAFVAEALPGLWISSGLCALTGHAFPRPGLQLARPRTPLPRVARG
ncbi:hypothetical protein EEDFHM_02107 [Methylorubrum populi]